MTHILCLVRADGSGYVTAVSDADRALGNLRSRWPHDFLPVAAVECPAETFASVTGMDPPMRAPLRQLALVFANLPFEPACSRAVQLHLQRLGPKAGPLFLEWRRAVQQAKEVAPHL